MVKLPKTLLAQIIADFEPRTVPGDEGENE